METSISVFF